MDKKHEFDVVKKPATENAALQELIRLDEQRFTKQMDDLIAEAEEMRLKRMKQHRTLSFMAMNVSIVCLTLGVAAFGWYLLMQINISYAVLSLIVSMIFPIIAHINANAPLKAYKRDHKKKFMPKLAKALNGLEFFPERGVSEKILEKLAVIPPYETYKAEDCFMGMYKGVKIIFSEARLYSKKQKNGTVFDGIFVLLENPSDVIEGHTIITVNKKIVEAYEKTRWKTMTRVHVSPSNPEWDIFDVFSTKPEAAELFVGDRLLKELAEASIIFDKAPLTAVLFGKKYVFLMIPCEKDMFEASNMYVPVATKQYAAQFKREIEQLLEIIDVFDLYKTI